MTRAQGPIRLVEVAQEELAAVQRFLRRRREGQEPEEFFSRAHWEGLREEQRHTHRGGVPGAGGAA